MKLEREIIIQPERRLCTVNGETGYFHCWEYYAAVVDASPLRGGHPAGQVSELRGIVEFEDRVERVTPPLIRFCDEENAVLSAFNKARKENDK